jgi:TonB family protein
MRRAQRVLLVAFALSLVLHAVVALVLHPATADFQTQPEAVSVVRRSTMIVARHTPPPPRRTQTPSPRNLAPPRPRASGAAVARSDGGSVGRSTPAPPAPSAVPSAAGAGCAQPNAAAAVVATPPPSDIPAAVRADHTSGVAVVSVTLDAQGEVSGASVARSTGNSSLDLVAVSMARDARYSAPLHDCKPVAGNATFSVKFVAW